MMFRLPSSCIPILAEVLMQTKRGNESIKELFKPKKRVI